MRNGKINANKTRFVRYKEGAALYSMCQTKFERLAKDDDYVEIIRAEVNPVLYGEMDMNDVVFNIVKDCIIQRVLQRVSLKNSRNNWKETRCRLIFNGIWY